MKHGYLILLIILILILFTLKVSICLNQRENTDIRLKIGPILRFRLKNSKITKICQSLTNYDFSVLLNKDNSYNVDRILKEIIIDKITIINRNNIFNTLWNIYIPFTYNILYVYIEHLLANKFKKVNNRYYSNMYTTTGSYQLNFEIILSIRVYQIIKILFIYFKNKKKVKYDKSNQ